MDLTPGQTRFQLGDLMRPGPVIATVGLVMLTISIVAYAFSAPSADLVAHPELAGSGASSVKYLVWMVASVCVVLFGAVLALLEFSKK